MASRTLFSQDGVTIRANLKAPVEVRFLQDGRAMATFDLAEETRVLDEESGEWSDGETRWHSAVAYGRLAEGLSQLRAGDTVVATGTVRIQEFDRRDGTKGTDHQLTVSDMGLSMRRYQNLSAPRSADPKAPVAAPVTAPAATHAPEPAV